MQALKFASEKTKDDREVVLAAFRVAKDFVEVAGLLNWEKKFPTGALAPRTRSLANVPRDRAGGAIQAFSKFQADRRRLFSPAVA